MSYFQTGGEIRFFPNSGGDQSCFNFNSAKYGSAHAPVMTQYWNSYISMYGVNIEYAAAKFHMEKTDMLYGEDPLMNYTEPRKLRVILDLQETTSLKRIGWHPEDVCTLIISIDMFYRTMVTEPYYTDVGAEVSPKEGDLFMMAEYGATRFGDRGAPIYEITEVIDNDNKSGINQFGNHYVWKCRAKRFVFSYEDENVVESGGMTQIDDSVFDKSVPVAGNSPEIIQKVAGPVKPNLNKENEQHGVDYAGLDDTYGGY